MAKKSKNILREDPTRTLTLRNRAVGEINRRWGEIQKLVTQSIVKNKVFLDNATPLTKDSFVFLRTPQKLDRFDAWLELTMRELILSGAVDPRSIEMNWLVEYIREAYIRGAKKANNEMASIVGRNQIPIRPDVFNVAFHIEKTALLFSRDFTQLKGITDVVSQQLNYHLSEGLLQGQNPRKIAKTLNERIDKIGISRSRLLARTEIINAHNLGSINEGLLLSETLGEEVVYLWITAGDIRVRDGHITRNNKYYSYEKVAQLIGEPNCRCATTPVPISRVPKDSTVLR